MNEFALIEQFFKSQPITRSDVIVGIGDDAACLRVPTGMELLVSTDTLVSGVHFLPNCDAYDIAYKAVMVNISDMAAMGADPCWLTLALTLPETSETWLASFARGLADAMKPFAVNLVGGDTTRGPLSVTITIMGLAPEGQSVKRNAAKPGDVIFVSGQLGAAALALRFVGKEATLPDAHRKELMEALLHPYPRVDLQDLLRAYATAAIDISDGLTADLQHICKASGVGACLDQDKIPMHPLLFHYAEEKASELALSGGDDYELCFTISPDKIDSFMSNLQKRALTCYPVGIIERESGLRIRNPEGTCLSLQPAGYQHF